VLETKNPVSNEGTDRFGDVGNHERHRIAKRVLVAVFYLADGAANKLLEMLAEMLHEERPGVDLGPQEVHDRLLIGNPAEGLLLEDRIIGTLGVALYPDEDEAEGIDEVPDIPSFLLGDPLVAAASLGCASGGH